MLRNLVKVVASNLGGKRTWTAIEVRELIRQRDFGGARRAADKLSTASNSPEAEKACLLGEVCFQERDDASAEAHFREALVLSPAYPEAHYGLSLIMAERRAFDDAVRHAQFALGPVRKEGRYLAQFGYCHLCLGNYPVAEGALRQATLAMPADPFVWNNLGIVLRAKGDADESRQCFERALALSPTFSNAKEHLEQLEREVNEGMVARVLSVDNTFGLRPSLPETSDPGVVRVQGLEAEGRLQEAIDAAEELLVSGSSSHHAPVLLSRLYERAGDLDSAIDTLRAFLSAHPDASSVAGALGLVYLRAQDYWRAEPLLRRAAEAEPLHLDYVVALAKNLAAQERFGDAAPFFERAVELAPENLGVLGQLVSNLANECRYLEAMEIIDSLVAKGKRVTSHGSVLAYLGRFPEALSVLNEQIQYMPHDPGLRFQRAHVHLLLENYSQGWDDYGFRGLSVSKHFRMLPFPLWRGEPLEGKKVIVLAEQGLGDQIMFASCLKDILALNPARVVVEMSVRVAPTIRRSFPQCDVVATKQDADLDWVKDYPDTDMFIPLADLPAHFRRSSSSFPRHQGYIAADPDRVAFWRSRLEATGPGPYIGLSWKGGTELTRKVVRSLRPEELMPLKVAGESLSGVVPTWVCLQYGEVQGQVDGLSERGWPMAYWPESIADLDEFAALISALDLVVTVCNTTVHYAGALNKPVWVLSPRVPEWRYGLNTESLPWYPSSKIWRQSVDGEWSGPIQSVGQELSAFIVKGTAAGTQRLTV
jgi:tetratricopeptide (TPR) repeat protein